MPSALATVGCVTATATAHVVPVTCVADGLDHLVTDDAHAAGVAAGTGMYLALCAHQVAAQPLASPPGPPCPRCALASRQSRAGRAQHRRGGRHRAHGSTR